MLKLVHHNEIDKQKWDRCIYYAFNSKVYAYSWYLDVVAPEWSALVWKDYYAVMPLFLQKKWGITYCAQPHFTQQLGIFTPMLLSPELINIFIRELKNVAKLSQINLNQNNLFKTKTKGISLKINHELDLILPHEQLYKNYSKNTKRNIKKAQKNRISVLKTQKPEPIIELFRTNKGQEVKHWKEAEYNMLKRLIYRALQLNQVEIWCAYTEDNSLCAGAFFLRNHRRHVFLFSGANQTAKDTGAMSYLIDTYIKTHCEEARILDFEGSQNPNLARFYRSFGAQTIHYPHLEINRLPWYISIPWQLKNKR